MANVKISQLPTDTAITGAELLTGIDGGVNKNISVQQIADFVGTGGGGASEFADLTDAATVDMAAVNAPLAADLDIATPTQITFTSAIPLTRACTLMSKALTADLVLTENASGQIPGAGGTIRIQQDTTPRTVTFPAGWVERPGSEGISTTAGMVHEVIYYYNGTDISYTVVQLGVLGTLTTPDTPTAGIVDDTADTFDWTNSAGYSAVSDYEYTLDGGSTYTTCSAKPISVGDVAEAIGQVGVRVKAVTGVNTASGTLYNATAFTVSGLSTPDTPTAPFTDDSADTFDWTNSAGYSAVGDYEYTVNGGSSYTTVTAKPISIGNVAKAAGQVGVRVKAVPAVSNASGTLYNTVAFLLTPAAPTAGVVDDTADTFDWTNTSGFAAASDYEYRIGGTGSFTAVSAKPLSVGSVAIAIGDLEVRVKAVAGVNTVSASLTNSTAFTAASLTLLEDQPFDSVNGWTAFSDSGNTSTISGGLLTIIRGGGGAAVCYKSGIFTPGDTLKITVDIDSITSGTPSVFVGDSGGSTGSENTLTAGVNVIDNLVSVSGAGNDFIIIRTQGGAAGEFVCDSIKIEKY